MGLDDYVEAHFPGKCRRDFNLWETGLWNFEEVWPTAVELYTLGEDFSYHHGFNFAVWRHLRLYDVCDGSLNPSAPTWRCKHCGFWADIWDYYPIEIHLMKKCQQVNIFSLLTLSLLFYNIHHLYNHVTPTY